MTTMRRIILAALLGITATFFAPCVNAAPAARGLGDPGKLQSLTVEIGGRKDGFRLAGRDASLQLIVTGQFASGQARDLTRSVTYERSPAGLVEVDATGLVTPLKEGKAIVTVKSGTVSATATISVT